MAAVLLSISVLERRAIRRRRTDFARLVVAIVVTVGYHVAAQASLGGVAERFKAPVLKTGNLARDSWVRIPPPPPVRKWKEFAALETCKMS